MKLPASLLVLFALTGFATSPGQARTATHAERASCEAKIQSKIDAISGNLRNTDVRGQIDKARTKAAANPGMVLGGLAALVIGAGLMRKRSAR